MSEEKVPYNADELAKRLEALDQKKMSLSDPSLIINESYVRLDAYMELQEQLDALRESLRWALGKIRTAEGYTPNEWHRCPYCERQLVRRNMYPNEPIGHAPDCPFLRAQRLAGG